MLVANSRPASLSVYRVVAAVVVTLTFMWVQWLFWPVFKPFVGALSYPALLASVLIGGLWGGLSSTVIATGIIAFVFMPPELTWRIENPNNLIALVVFVLLGVSFSITDHARRRAEYRLAESRAEERSLRESGERLEATLDSTTGILARVVEARDPYTAGHQRRVGELARMIAVELGLSAEDTRDAARAGLIHDVGKISVPVDVLTKPGPLSPIEMRFAQEHAQAGCDILADADIPESVVRYIHEHHERYDGTGYPQGLAGDDISLGGRILAVADTVEAMTSHRTYRASSTIEEAVAELSRDAGTKYDADVVSACLRVLARGDFTASAT